MHKDNNYFVQCYGREEPSPYDGAQQYFLSLLHPEPKTGRREDALINCACPVLRVDAPVPRTLECGRFDVVTLDVMRRLLPVQERHGLFHVRNVTGESRAMHSLARYRNGVIQAASQFNCLEFPTAETTPEQGIQGYEYDRTQGPACAIACAAGTAMRNYFVWRPRLDVPRGESTQSSSSAGGAPLVPFHVFGQTASDQINCLADLEQLVKRLMGLKTPPWTVRNGYIDSNDAALDQFNRFMKKDRAIEEMFLERIAIGVHTDTQVTDVLESPDGLPWLVTQTYNSAVSIGYSRTVTNRDLWVPLARLVLDASYEITLLVAIDNAIRQYRKQQQEEGRGSKPMTMPTALLTKVGGGVFQNHRSWIREAIARALEKCQSRIPEGMVVYVDVGHYGTIEEGYGDLGATIFVENAE